MYELINAQCKMFLLSIAMGALMGVTYDGIRCIRKLIKHGDLPATIEDIMYWIFWTGYAIYSIQNYNSGVLQIYVFLGIGIGAVIYLLTVSRLLLCIFDFILTFLRRQVEKIKKMLKKFVKKGNINVTVEKKENGD